MYGEYNVMEDKAIAILAPVTAVAPDYTNSQGNSSLPHTLRIKIKKKKKKPVSIKNVFDKAVKLILLNLDP